MFTAFNVVSLNQFSKLPLLIAHYVDHWERDHNIGLGAFIDMHYLGHDIKDNDDKKDKELPFKTVSLNSIEVFTVPAHEIAFIIHPEFIASGNEPFFTKDQFIPTQAMSSLFRPPRVSA